MPTILITGAASGLGLAFTNYYATTQPNTTIRAVDIAPFTPTHPNVIPYQIDITSETSVISLATSIKDTPINLLIHSAGIRGLVPALEKQQPNDVAFAETLDGMDLETLTHTFNINAAGTFLLLRALLSNLRLASKTSGAQAKVVVMSSRMGSIGNNQLPNAAAGGAYAYRASKAALNALVRSFAVDVPEVVWVLCHPGRVETGLVLCVEEGAISAEESVGQVAGLIEGWGKGDSGRFYDRFGGVIEW